MPQALDCLSTLEMSLWVIRAAITIIIITGTIGEIAMNIAGTMPIIVRTGDIAVRIVKIGMTTTTITVTTASRDDVDY